MKEKTITSFMTKELSKVIMIKSRAKNKDAKRPSWENFLETRQQKLNKIRLTEKWKETISRN